MAVCVVTGVAAKFNPVTFAPLMVAVWLTGLKEKPDLLGVTVYVPFANPLKV
jgi:hypothetical protein